MDTKDRYTDANGNELLKYPKTDAVQNHIWAVRPEEDANQNKKGLSESEMYLTSVHENIHHFDRYETESKEIVASVVKSLEKAGRNTFDINDKKFKIAKFDAGKDYELLAYSIEMDTIIDNPNQNKMSRMIAELFKKRNGAK